MIGVAKAPERRVILLEIWLFAPAAAALAALVLFMIAPSRSRRADEWRGTPFAHRGLHGDGVEENTLEAFERACRAGVGIELDVQLSRDGEAVVFHDETLMRLAGDPRRVDQVDWAELRSMRLCRGGRIPSLKEALERIDGRAPLLVELKNGRGNRRLCETATALLRGYRGAYLVESFNPLMLRWLKKHAPDVVRGQLVGAAPLYLAVHAGRVGAFALSKLTLNFLARPDFIAYDVSASRYAVPRVQRRLFHAPLAAWTVRDEETYRACAGRGEMPIFEGFVPDGEAARS